MLLGEVLPDTRAFDGCEGVTVYTDSDDRQTFLFVEFFQSKEHQQRYVKWRTETGVMAQLGENAGRPAASPLFRRYRSLTKTKSQLRTQREGCNCPVEPLHCRRCPSPPERASGRMRSAPPSAKGAWARFIALATRSSTAPLRSRYSPKNSRKTKQNPYSWTNDGLLVFTQESPQTKFRHLDDRARW